MCDGRRVTDVCVGGVQEVLRLYDSVTWFNPLWVEVWWVTGGRAALTNTVCGSVSSLNSRVELEASRGLLLFP